jgi:hypothetical protein
VRFAALTLITGSSDDNFFSFMHSAEVARVFIENLVDVEQSLISSAYAKYTYVILMHCIVYGGNGNS